MSTPGVTPPRVLSADEVELLKKQRDLVLPSARLATYDDFAKWLFTTITVVGTLAAAFSNTALKGLSGTGVKLFFAAVGLVGASLAIAIVLRGVEPKNPNWQSLDDMLDKSKRAVLFKRKLAWAAGGLFAIAIVLAALAPIFSSELPKVPSARGLTLTLGPNGLHAVAKMGANAKGLGDVRITAVSCKGEKLIAAQHVKNNASDTLEVDATSSPVPSDTKSVRVYVSCGDQQTSNSPTYTFEMDLKSPAQTTSQTTAMCFR